MANTAVITGATSGIGYHFARVLARQGYDLVMGGRREELLRARGEELSRAGVAVDVVVGDLSDESVVRVLEHHASRCDVLVNSAGYGLPGDFDRTSSADLLRMMKVHQEVPLRLMRAALPRMREKRNGLVINVGSMACRLPLPGGALYSSTKAFVERISESLALENARHGVVVQALVPGFVVTDFHRDDPRFAGRRVGPGWLSAERVVAVSLKRAGAAARLIRRQPGAIPRARHTIVTPGLFYTFASAIGCLVPRRILYRGVLTLWRSQQKTSE
jgi:short-subunit dehydrogenase